ncbi:universal stress protein [Halosolutus gelatinilyticus]|uniref:universal stress protein n=1 Tax=Halosolutus gelatinilyticus TaxID=2931975 RepID=UPI001FF14AC1|nr:universal stress protein [Halosolutus gelatinilyticus]
MTDHVLVPIDNTPLSETVLSYAFDRYPDAAITALHVVPGVRDAPLELTDASVEDRQDASTDLFERAEAVADERDRPLETVTLFGSPARSILEFEQDEDVDAIVLGSHGRHGMERLLLGSVAETVARRASVPVTIVR